MFAWFRSYTGALPTGYCDHLLTGDSRRGKDFVPAPRPCFGVQNYCDDHSRSACLLWKRTLPIRWGSTLTTSISASRFTATWPIWCFSFFTNITRLLRPLPKQKTCSRSSMIYIELMSCSRLNIRHHNELRLPPRYHLRKMMQSWLHHLRPTTHNLRRRPAPCPRSVRRPSMASRLMVRFNNNLGSSSLFTDFLPRLPSRRRHSCSPHTARQMTSSSTTRMPKRDAPTFAAMAALWGLEPGYITKLTDKALCHLIVTARLLTG